MFYTLTCSINFNNSSLLKDITVTLSFLYQCKLICEIEIPSSDQRGEVEDKVWWITEKLMNEWFKTLWIIFIAINVQS